MGVVLCFVILFATLVSVPHTNDKTCKTKEIIDTQELPPYISHEQLSMLYTCKSEKRRDKNIELTNADANLLMAVARTEGGPTLEGQLWAMNTIYNRLEDDWGDSLWEILTDESQFDVVISGAYKTADINVESHLALAQFEMRDDPTQGALYWEANTNSPNSWHKQNLTFIKEVEGNLYYK